MSDFYNEIWSKGFIMKRKKKGIVNGQEWMQFEVIK